MSPPISKACVRRFPPATTMRRRRRRGRSTPRVTAWCSAGAAGSSCSSSLERARARGARIRAEIVGYGATSDGYSFVHPRPDGAQAAACMRMALSDAGVEPEAIDYVNAHGTSTVVGDRAEVEALRLAFRDRVPPFSSTKSMTGHAMTAAGVHELIYCVGMLEQGFLAPSINVDEIDPAFAGLPLVRETVERDVATIMSNNFGFGGTNASLILRRAPDA